MTTQPSQEPTKKHLKGHCVGCSRPLPPLSLKRTGRPKWFCDECSEDNHARAVVKRNAALRDRYNALRALGGYVVESRKASSNMSSTRRLTVDLINRKQLA